MAYDRYSYVFNNPIRYTDPSGHCPDDDGDGKCDPPRTWLPAYETCDGITYEGKDCFLVPVGTWHITNYRYAVEGEKSPDYYSSPAATVSVNLCNGSNCQSVDLPYRLILGSDGMYIQGTAITNGYGPIHGLTIDGDFTEVFTTHPNGNTVLDYVALGGDTTLTAYQGYGPLGELTPYYSAAVGPSYAGGLFYVEEAMFGYHAGGIFYGADRGGRIEDGDMDIFIGNGYAASKFANDKYKWDYSGVVGNFTVYEVVCP